MEPKILAKNFHAYLKSLKGGTRINEWVYMGETKVAFGSAGGSWEGHDGFLFNHTVGNYSFILRSSIEKAILVIESVTTERQLFNFNLTKENNYIAKNGSCFLKESYNMTLGMTGRVPKEKVIESFNKAGFDSDIICTIDEHNPDYDHLIKSFLDWGIVRDNVRKILTENIPSEDMRKVEISPDNAIYKISMSPKPSEIPDDAYNNLISNNLIAVAKNTKAKAVSAITQGSLFVDKMKIGDYFYLCRGNKQVVLIGKITGNAEVCSNNELAAEGFMQRRYEKISDSVKKGKYSGPQKWWSPNDNSTCIEIPEKELTLANKELFKPFFNVHLSKNKSKMSAEKIVLNQILFGPPGTGKTYHTIEKAIQIANPSFVIPDELAPSKKREVQKVEFDRLKNEGQIVFTTFHQSMSYEDFIEGIKPKKPDSESTYLKYEIQDGLFKSLCLEAQSKTKKISFDEAYDLFIQEIRRKKTIDLNTPKKGNPYTATVNGKNNIEVIPKTQSATRMVVTKEMIKNYVLYNIKKGWKTYAIPLGDSFMEHFRNEGIEVVSGDNGGGKYVLIIDEINRGNVSQIFGELITLIEEDKRLGCTEALEVMLPYSKKMFGVPANLYIIGTMNTADRSVEALDTALRRRFSFEFVGPDTELVPEDIDGVKLRVLFETINNRISYLLDDDHQIGHSYFMQVKTISDIKAVFENKLIPLLKEYFYNDYGKIRLVLGEGFVSKTEFSKNPVSFALKDDDFIFEKATFKFNTILSNEDFKLAIEKTLKNA